MSNKERGGACKGALIAQQKEEGVACRAPGGTLKANYTVSKGKQAAAVPGWLRVRVRACACACACVPTRGL